MIIYILAIKNNGNHFQQSNANWKIFVLDNPQVNVHLNKLNTLETKMAILYYVLICRKISDFKFIVILAVLNSNQWLYKQENAIMILYVLVAPILSQFVHL